MSMCEALDEREASGVPGRGARGPLERPPAAAARGDTYQVTGTVPLNMKDFDINVPSYLGQTVKPDIETTVSFSCKKH